MTGSGSSDELKRLHPSGQATPSGRSKAVRTGGATRFGGSGHDSSSALSSSSTFSNLSSSSPSSANLMRFVLMSEVGSSAGERSHEIFYEYKSNRMIKKTKSIHKILLVIIPACLREDQYCL